MKNWLRESDDLHTLVRKAVVFHCGTEQFDPLIVGCGYTDEHFKWKEWVSCEEMLEALKAESEIKNGSVLFKDDSRVNISVTIYNWKPSYEVEFAFWLENNLPSYLKK